VPEGDTIHKIAAYMAPELNGRRVDGVRLGIGAETQFSGAEIRSVEARGKHLRIQLDNGKMLRSHLGMYGSWHVYAPETAWQKPSHQASLILDAAGRSWVCFNAREIEIVDDPAVRRRLLDTRLGPDLIADELDTNTIVTRAREFEDGDTLLVDCLLDQRVAAGIGNVYKSEVMFLEGLPPDRRLCDATDAVVSACFSRAAGLLRRNLGGGKRVTRFERDGAGRLWVYGRKGLPCHVCSTPIRYRRMGRSHRSTFWCPSCQSTGQ
jgi:endonuclease-8